MKPRPKKIPQMEQAAPPVPKLELGSKNGTAHAFALRCLTSGLASSKEWAAELGVSDRVVRAWSSGEKEIPDARIESIFIEAKRFCLRLDELEAFLDRALLSAYGKSDPGRF